MAMISMKEYGRRVQALLDERGMNSFELSLAAEIRETTIRRWLKGIGTLLPEIEFIKRTADALGVTLTDLVESDAAVVADEK